MRVFLPLCLLLGACSAPEALKPAAEPAAEASANVGPASAPGEHAATASKVRPGKDGRMAWDKPDEKDIPEGPLGDSIRRGKDLIDHTSERLPAYTPTTMSCSSCHIDSGREPLAAPLVGTYARFPKYMPRTGAIITVQERVNYCFTRSLSGSRLPMDSEEMVDIVNYIAWLSKDIPVGTHVEDEDLPTLAKLEADAARGEKLFGEKCVACHQATGEGVPGAFPALWGPKSYSIGASMAREERAASFIKHFMPQNARGSLTEQEAYDLAAFINAHPRPDSPSKELDWPEGGAPYDVPYATKGHEAYRPPELLARANPDQAVVGKPVSVRSSK